MSEFPTYEALKSASISASEAYEKAREDGLGKIEAIKMLRLVYGLTLTDAKTLSFESDTGRSLESFQHDMAKELPEVLDEISGHDA